FAKPKVLLLSVLLQQINVSMVDKIGVWLLNNKVILDLTSPRLLHDSTTILADPDYRRLINQFIKAAKLGFETIEERIEGMAKNSLNISAEIIRLAHYKEIEKFELYTKHELYDESFILKDYIYFDMLTNESAGTQRYFILVAQLVYALKKGQILWIDEIDSRFHTLLLQLLIKLYNSKKNNVNGSQLIFTSHNTSLLNKQLRRDQVNFVEKDKFGASSIVRMHTAKTPVRAESAVEKDYLRGDLGGIGLFAQDEEIK
ncbi:MAG: AAA family ATPase, partial [Chitinophagaceae bacterium]